ncbi:uncharacterized protein FIBRA_00610 [Fibroporia radiculosa]|uniref:ATP-dependent DNA helicase PIF1 n=1 Tax=Fibroporia radiculosa TaxID=599839 RepID=J4G0H3_9APHY|nr:uncharacterized protein FIBRA_00610 [Fibroporia radiculosa]CCL98608.1 predicted protein [Fibroporia radiculosa]
MPPPPKQSISGLRSIKRDFSSFLPSASQDSVISSSDPNAIPWTPTPPKQSKLSGAEQRLRDIEEALKGNLVSSEIALASSQTSRSTMLQKRPSSSQDPPAKRRQLPSSWNDPEPIQRSAYFSSSSTRTPVVNKTLTNNAPGRTAPISLSQEQQHILQLVREGQNIFYTGSAGTGKSVLLREIIAIMRAKHSRSPDAVAVTASTGIAACNIGGMTIHSFSGIGLGLESAEVLANKVRKNKKASARWARTQVLIIDEISMVEGELFDKIAHIGSILRKRPEPFGGIQVVVTGDFFQLPPVTKGQKATFAFEAEMWRKTIKKTFNLTQVFRQRDPEFVDMLNEMRFGKLTPGSIARFRSLARDIVYEDGLGATELFPLREDVERSNTARMRVIQGETRSFTALDGGTLTDETQREKMLNNFMAPKTLTLKIGAQVMLIKNIDDTLVNGSMGKIVKFIDPSASLEEDDIAYGGKPSSKNGKAGKKQSSGVMWPVVDFLQPGGGLRRVTVQPESWKVELPNGEVQVSRTQLPLILAWAMSIHKSQGQTLERVKVDLAKVFEKGQAYVALSRATCLDGLQVLHFDPARVNAHPKVVDWTRTLATVS